MPQRTVETMLNSKISNQTRRNVLRSGTMGIGAAALAWLLDRDTSAAHASTTKPHTKQPMFAPRAKNVIFLHMTGGPSQMDMFDPKPALEKYQGRALPAELVEGIRFAFVKGDAKVLASPYKFHKHGQSGIEMSTLVPHLSKVADELTVIRSMQTDEINHGAAELFMHTGSGRVGRPAFGSWVTYGLGSECENLPGFMVLMEGGGTASGKNLWSSGFLPTVYQGVRLRSGSQPVLYLSNPGGMSRQDRRDVIDVVGQLNQSQYEVAGDPEIQTRIAQYEMAFRMQSSVPDLMELISEPQHILDMYGAVPGEKSFANTCLLSRRLVESGVRFVQIFLDGWDNHAGIYSSLPRLCKKMDQPVAALIQDLKQRGLLDETLVIWGGEFGRTPMVQAFTPAGETQSPGRDHHKDAFTIWMAGGGVKAGYTHGETDEFGFRPVRDAVHVHDFQATVLHLLGVDHLRLTYRVQGRDFRLTDVHGNVVQEILA
jgi:hypothetical protein